MGLVYGLTLTLLNEMMLFAGQIVGMQFSFSMVNLLDPTSSIQTPLMGDLFQLMGTLVVIGAGLDRILLASLVRSFRAAPLGSYALAPVTALAIVRAAGGHLSGRGGAGRAGAGGNHAGRDRRIADGQAQSAVAGDDLTVPLKTLTGFALLIGRWPLWPRFIEARFGGLLDMAERLIRPVPGARGAGYRLGG